MSQITIPQPLPVLEYQPPPQSRLRPILTRAAFWSVIIFVVTAALVLGLILRRYAWDQTEPIRYQLDINNAFHQGSESLTLGYLNRYDERTSREKKEGMFDLDYAPGRLAIATLWADWVRNKVDWSPKAMRGLNPWEQEFYPHARLLKMQYELCKPMLMVNLTGEILSAIAMFFLVRRYTSGTAPNPRPTRGIILGLTSALLFWFNPALIWNAHCWPQWDSWVLPFFLWALLLASLDWWFCAGAIIAAGAMFKGQILFGAPLFLLWPLFQGRLPAVARWIAGLLITTAAATAVWILRTPGTNPTGRQFVPGAIDQQAVEWVVYLTLIFIAMTSLLWRQKKWWMKFPTGLVVAAVVAWLIATHSSHAVWVDLVIFCVLAAAGWAVDDRFAKWSWKAQLPLGWAALAILIYPIYLLVKDWQIVGIVLIATGAMGMLIFYAPRRAIPYAAALWVALAMLTCMPLFNTSKGWFYWGIAYGTHHFERMSSGDNNNLAALLEQQWHWDDVMAPAITLPRGQLAESISSFLTTIDPGVKLDELKTSDGGLGLPLKYLLVSVWIASVILSSIGAAMHDRNRSPRFLIAIATPWIMFFAVMLQMHQRYLLWGASLSAASAVISPGYAALYLFLSIVAMSQEMHSMLGDGGAYRGNVVFQFLENWHPGVSWAVLLTAGIFLYTTLKRDKSASKSLPVE